MAVLHISTMPSFSSITKASYFFLGAILYVDWSHFSALYFAHVLLRLRAILPLTNLRLLHQQKIQENAGYKKTNDITWKTRQNYIPTSHVFPYCASSCLVLLSVLFLLPSHVPTCSLTCAIAQNVLSLDLPSNLIQNSKLPYHYALSHKEDRKEKKAHSLFGQYYLLQYC